MYGSAGAGERWRLPAAKAEAPVGVVGYQRIRGERRSDSGLGKRSNQ